MQGILKSKTMLFAVLLAVLGVLEAQANVLRDLLLPYLGDLWTGLVLMVVAIAVAVLRVVTTVPLSEK